jgi:hypothetical protein
MRVGNPNDRQEMPECCDGCGCEVSLKRFVSYGPGHQVDWLCRFCANSNKKEHSLSGLFNELVKAIREIVDAKA